MTARTRPVFDHYGRLMFFADARPVPVRVPPETCGGPDANRPAAGFFNLGACFEMVEPLELGR